MHMNRYTVTFQGIEGSFSHQAVNKVFHSKVTLLPEDTFEDAFYAISNGKAQYGVLPIDNSSTGPISEVYDLLYKYNLHIIGETYIQVEHHLLGLKDSSIDMIEEVYSHPQAIKQCKRFLKCYPKWRIIPYYDTAKSAKFIMEQNNPSLSAIGSMEAAKLYNLKILKRDIHDNSLNFTRFLVLSSDLNPIDNYDKISIILTPSNDSNALYNIMNILDRYNIRIIKLCTRPIVDYPFTYMFYMDLKTDMPIEKTQQVLEYIKNHCTNFRLLGIYDEDKTCQNKMKPPAK